MFREDGFNMFLSYTLCVLVSTLNVYIQSYDAFFRFAVDWLIPVCVPVTEELLWPKYNKRKTTQIQVNTGLYDIILYRSLAHGRLRHDNKNYVKR